MSYIGHSVHIDALAAAVRSSAPMIHNITNLVVQGDTAAAIAAVGGTQLTLHAPEEAREVAAASDAVAVNIGTLDDTWLRCAREAVRTAIEHGCPWVLDPVAAGLTRYRTEAAQGLLRLGPAVLRGNASEIRVLAGDGGPGRGADSRHRVSEAAGAARRLARDHGCVVVVTGAEDLITDGAQAVTVGNGHPLMGRMIGSGCMLTAVIAAFLAVAESPFEAAAAAVACFDVAGELAAGQAGGPGTLKPLLVDALHGLTRATLEARLRLGGIPGGA